MDPYEYAAPAAEGLVPLCKKIASTKTKDALVKSLKQLVSILEACTQDVEALGRGKDELPRTVLHLLQHADKDVKLYLAVCIVNMLRIWAPETPYDGDPENLEAALGVVLWVVNRLQNHTAPTFQMAVSVLQVFCQTKSYYLLTDDREELELEWFRALLDCVTEANAESVELYANEILCGMLEDDSMVTQPKVEALLSCLVSPASDESPAAAALARSVLRRREREVQPTLQRLLTRLLTSPITASSGLWEQSYSVVAQLHEVTPQALLPVVPLLSDELCAPDAARRLEAVRLLGRLFGQRGGGAVAAEWGDVLTELLRRFKDEKADIRMEMVQLAFQMAATLPTEDMRAKVLEGVFERLRDPDEKVRAAACKAACAAASPRAGAVPNGTAGGAAAGGAAQLEEISVRMRDTKPVVRRAAAGGLLSLFRARVLKGGVAGGEGLYWIPARAMMCACADPQMRLELETGFWKDGLLGPSAPPGLAAQVWAEIWRQAAPQEVQQALLILEAKAALQAEVLAFLELRRMLAGTEGDQRSGLQAKLDAAARKVAKRFPDPPKAAQHLAALAAARDNKVFASLQAALALGARSEAAARAGGDAIQRVGSKSPLADFLRQLLAYAQPSLFNWEVAAGVLDLAAGFMPRGAAARGRKARGGDAAGRDGGEEGEGEAGSGSESEGEEEEEEDEEGAGGAARGKRARRGGRQQQQAAAPPEPGSQGAAEGAPAAVEVSEAARGLCRQLSKKAGGLFAGQAPRLRDMLARAAADDEEEEGGAKARAAAADVQTLAAQLLSRWGRAAAALAPGGAAAGAGAARPPAGSAAAAPSRDTRRGGGGAPAASQGAAAAAAAAAAGADATSLESLRPELMRVAAGGPPKAARHAVAALHFLFGSASNEELSSLCSRLVRGLTPKAAADPATLSHLHALSAIGQYLPDSLAPHAEQLVVYVTTRILPAYISDPNPRPRGAGAAGGGGDEGPTVAEPGYEVAAKCGALAAAARALAPEHERDEVRVETIRAAGSFIDELERLLDVESPPEFLPPGATPEQEGAARLAAARALMRLMRRHDVRLTQGAYSALALTMQDPVMDVRRLFALKLVQAIKHVNLRPHYHQLPAKMAAMLALGAADPVDAHKRHAAAALRDWVVARRAAAQRMITAAAADRAAEGGSTMQEQPEMAISYLIHLLAHHPDMPKADEPEIAECLEPFQHMLQAVLSPLLASAPPAAGGAAAAGPAAALPLVLKVLRVLKGTEDNVDDAEASATLQIRMLCDVAVKVAGAIAVQLPGIGSLDALRERGLLQSWPGAVVLPTGLYRRPDSKPPQGTTYLPPGFRVSLDPDLLALQSAAPPAFAGAKRARPRGAAGAAAGRAKGGAAGAGAGGKAKRARTEEGAAAGGRRRGGGTASGDTADDWGSDDEGAGAGKPQPASGRRAAPRRGAAPAGGYAEPADDLDDFDLPKDDDLGDLRDLNAPAGDLGAGGAAGEQEESGGSGSEGAAAAAPAARRGAAAAAGRARGAAAAAGKGAGGSLGKQQTLNFAAAAADASSPGPGSKGRLASQERRAADAAGGGTVSPRPRGGTAAAARAQAAGRAAAAALAAAARPRRGAARGGGGNDDEEMEVAASEDEGAAGANSGDGSSGGGGANGFENGGHEAGSDDMQVDGEEGAAAQEEEEEQEQEHGDEEEEEEEEEEVARPARRGAAAGAKPAAAPKGRVRRAAASPSPAPSASPGASPEGAAAAPAAGGGGAEAEAEQPPAKRGRGRPKGTTKAAKAAAEAAAAAAAAAAREAAAPRGRGRPRKERQEEAGDDHTATTDQMPSPAATAGRKPRGGAAAAAAAAGAPSEAPGRVRPRRR